MARKRKKRYRFRDAGTGRFVTPGYAKRHPKRTIRQTVKAPSRRKK